MAELYLPITLPSLYEDLPRQLEIEAATVNEAFDRLVQPGPALRPHINVFVDREQAGLDTAIDAGSRVDVIAAISGG